VDEELSPLVQRSFSLAAATPDSLTAAQRDPYKASLLTGAATEQPVQVPATVPSTTENVSDKLATTSLSDDDESKTVLRVDYKATTNRMLRVAVNGFFESLGVVIQVMEELDVDVLHEKGIEGLEGVQGVEQGMTGTTVMGA
jgi:EKC/KEOPS complex subunit PCC1/LAGE3